MAISLIYLIIYTRYLLKAIRLIILIKNGENYEIIDWKKIFDKEYSCGLDFDSRFPPLNISSNSQSITGNLTYSMVSYGFKSILENETFKLKIKIKDRGLNNSNIIETQDFTLTSILKENWSN